MIAGFIHALLYVALTLAGLAWLGGAL